MVQAQTRLIDDLLDVARITSGKLLLDLQKVELPLVAASAVEVISASAEAKKVAVEVCIPCRRPAVGILAERKQPIGEPTPDAS